MPVVASLGALSFTDFDIYAVADLANLRFVGLANYRRLLDDAALLDRAPQHRLLRRASAAPLSVAPSLGAALLAERAARRAGKGVLPHASSSCRW